MTLPEVSWILVRGEGIPRGHGYRITDVRGPTRQDAAIVVVVGADDDGGDDSEQDEEDDQDEGDDDEVPDSDGTLRGVNAEEEVCTYVARPRRHLPMLAACCGEGWS